MTLPSSSSRRIETLPSRAASMQAPIMTTKKLRCSVWLTSTAVPG
jgi:hypothetical protein